MENGFRILHLIAGGRFEPGKASALEAAQKENSDERSSASEATQKALQSAIKESSEERGSAPDATHKALQSAIRDRKEGEEKQAIEKKGTKSPTE